jgi:hypothetical protein
MIGAWGVGLEAYSGNGLNASRMID